MKKRERLHLHRETVCRLEAEVAKLELGQAGGGIGAEKCTGCPSGCGIYYDTNLNTL